MGVTKRLLGIRMMGGRRSTAGDHLSAISGLPRLRGIDDQSRDTIDGNPLRPMPDTGPVRVPITTPGDVDPTGGDGGTSRHDRPAGTPQTGLSIRQYGLTQDALEIGWETGDPLPDGNSRSVVYNRIRHDDGSTDYWVRDRWGGCLRIVAPAPRAETQPPSVPAPPPRIERTETGTTARFLDSLFRGGFEANRPVVYDNDMVTIEGDSNPPGGLATWFLRRKADGAAIVVRLDLPTRPAGIPDPRPMTSDDASTITHKSKPGKLRQSSFAFVDDVTYRGPY